MLILPCIKRGGQAAREVSLFRCHLGTLAVDYCSLVFASFPAAAHAGSPFRSSLGRAFSRGLFVSLLLNLTLVPNSSISPIPTGHDLVALASAAKRVLLRVHALASLLLFQLLGLHEMVLRRACWLAIAEGWQGWLGTDERTRPLVEVVRQLREQVLLQSSRVHRPEARLVQILPLARLAELVCFVDLDVGAMHVLQTLAELQVRCRVSGLVRVDAWDERVLAGPRLLLREVDVLEREGLDRLYFELGLLALGRKRHGARGLVLAVKPERRYLFSLLLAFRPRD